MGAVTALLMSRYGRRASLLINLVVVMVCCALSLLKVDLGNQWTLKRGASIVGSKWGVAAVFMIVYMYTNEVRLHRLVDIILLYHVLLILLAINYILPTIEVN